MKYYWIGALLVLIVTPALASPTVIQMKNNSGSSFMVFEPAFVQIKPGETVTFRATDKGHDAESIPSILPSGAAPFKGRIGQDISVMFTKPGLYGVKCNPHFGMGMVALIEVGTKPSNRDAAIAAIATFPGLAKKKMGALLAQLR